MKSVEHTTPTLLAALTRIIALAFLALSLSRLTLMLTHHERVGTLQDGLWVLLQGLRVDAITIAYLLLIPVLAAVWLQSANRRTLAVKVVKVWSATAFTFLVFMEILTPEYIREYDTRPGRVFFEYLIYPNEVMSMLWTGYKPTIAIALIVLAASVYLANRVFRHTAAKALPVGIGRRILLSLVIVLAGSLIMRSSLQHRPFNPAMIYFSSDNLTNALMLNSSYSLLYAIYNTRSEKSAASLYGKLDSATVIQAAQALLPTSRQHLINDQIPTLQYHRASHRGTPRNIVILLQESLGARFVGALNGVPEEHSLTPELDKLIPQGWNFTQAYATGTRSVRGIEAVMTGFLPGPSRSVVKLSKSQRNFFTLAAFLKAHHYATQFIYGGESHFDNMKSFMLGNGVDEVLDVSAFDNPQFIGSWGASDEDLYREAHRSFESLHRQGQPFFSFVFSTSNHSPWEFPSTCRERFQAPIESRENGIRYADCALGKFFADARQSSYWNDTLFLVIADHDAGGSAWTEMVPLQHFQVPALILGGGIAPRHDDRLISQIDLPPTLLSLAGISGLHPMTGHDLTHEVSAHEQRAIFQYGELFTVLTPDSAVVIRPHDTPLVLAHQARELGDPVPVAHEEQAVSIAHALSLWSDLAYDRQLYRMPTEEEQQRALNASLVQDTTTLHSDPLTY